MNEYYMNVNFNDGKIDTNLIELVQNDYNSAKINFTFDKEGIIQFKMLFPDKETAYLDEIKNNEIILGEGTLQQSGKYKIEISINGNDNRLTNYATHTFDVRKELISTDEIIEADDRIPILDSLINEVNTAISQTDNLDIEANKVDTTTTVTITKKDGTEETVQILDGSTGPAGRDGTDGSDGITPTIGNNGNWYLGETDTGKPSRGEKGADGVDGTNGVDGFSPIATVSKSGNTATITITDETGTTWTNIVDGTNGIDGITPNIQVGTTTTLPAGYNATVIQRGTTSNPIFDFGIPKGEDGSAGTLDYTELTNKPSINGVTLTGNKTTSDLGIVIPDVDIDNSSITRNNDDELQTVGIIDRNTSLTNKIWTGTLAQYNALVSGGQIDNNTFYNITDDGATIVIDDNINSTSENPVQNKVIKSALDTKVNQSSITSETWTFTLSDNTTVTKNVVIHQ